MGLMAGLVMGLLAGLTRRRATWSLLPALVAFSALWRLRQMSGAEVVRTASHQTQTVLTIIAVLIVTAWWVVGQLPQRPDLNSQQ